MAKQNNAKAKADGLNPKDQKDPITITDMGDGRTRLRVQFDITYKGHQGHIVEGQSHTEPDMTLRLGQLLERHSRGKDIPMKTPVYFDTEIPTFSDLTDIERYREQLQRRLEETTEFIRLDKEKTAVKEKSKTKANSAGKQLELKDDPSYKEKAEDE